MVQTTASSIHLHSPSSSARDTQSRESRHRIAVLEEEDVETFVAFCEYAYTGDYKVPQIPVPREHRVGVAESAHSPVNSWRGTHRSSSMSSAVPPPAPSPPPEFVDNGPAKIDSGNQQPEPEPEPTPVIGEEPAAEAAAEAEAQAEEVPKEAEGQAEAEPTEEDKAQVEPAQEPTEEKNDEAEQTQDAGLSSPPEVEQQQPETEPATETDDWASWPAEQTPQESTETKGKKGKKKDKKKQKKNLQVLNGEAPANLTPPTTPPTHPVEMHEISPDNAEEPAEPIEAEPVAEQTAEVASSETPAETPAEPEHFDPEPAEATPAEPEPEPTQPSPADAEQDPESVPKSTGTPPPEEWSTPNNEEQQDNEVWPSNDQPEPIDPPKPVIDMSFAKQPDTSPRTPGMSLWDEFATLQYNDENHNQHHNQVMPISTTDETPTEIPYLTFHAKVYVFATRYLIPALAQLCLRKLHHDLVHLTFADIDPNRNRELDPYQDRSGLGGLAARQAPRVLDLIRYSYTKTTRLEPISPTSATQLRENELRRLVVHYTACKVKELARYHSPGDSEVATPSLRPIDVHVHAHAREKDDAPKSLRSLLDMTPELASDLVYRMM